MLKGVNKQIIEVTDTGNKYIQKAILFVAPEKNGYDPDFLVHQARKYLEQTQPKSPVKPKRKFIGKKLIWSLLHIGAGAGLALIITLWIK